VEKAHLKIFLAFVWLNSYNSATMINRWSFVTAFVAVPLSFFCQMASNATKAGPTSVDPDPSLTPGEVNPEVAQSTIAQNICSKEGELTFTPADPPAMSPNSAILTGGDSRVAAVKGLDFSKVNPADIRFDTMPLQAAKPQSGARIHIIVPTEVTGAGYKEIVATSKRDEKGQSTQIRSPVLVLPVEHSIDGAP
jgi:hypothetical protein